MLATSIDGLSRLRQHDGVGRRPRVPSPHWKIPPISWQAAGLTRFAGIDDCWIEATQ